MAASSFGQSVYPISNPPSPISRPIQDTKKKVQDNSWGHTQTHQLSQSRLSLLVYRPHPVIHSLLLFFQHLRVCSLLETLRSRGAAPFLRLVSHIFLSLSPPHHCSRTTRTFSSSADSVKDIVAGFPAQSPGASSRAFVRRRLRPFVFGGAAARDRLLASASFALAAVWTRQSVR